MKALKISLLAFVMTLSMTANAQKLFNVQNETKSLFFESIDEAIEQSVSGDIIYLPGTTIQVADKVIIDKKLTLIGAGYDADSIGGLQPTRIMKKSALAEINFREGSDGSMLTGCEVGNITFGHREEGGIYRENIKDVLIWRNSIYNISLGMTTDNMVSQITIKENILDDYINGQNARSCLVHNNIIYGSFYGIHGLIDSQIENNIFRSGLYYLNNCTVDNNYFLYSGHKYNDNITFRNNATAALSGLPTDDANPGNINNVIAADIFEGGADPNTMAGYRVKPGSLCEKAGLDGTDIGIFGGTSPFKLGGKPFNPHIDRSVVSVQSDGEGKLKIDIQVSAQER